MNTQMVRNLDVGELVDNIDEAMELGKQLRDPTEWTNKVNINRFFSKVFQIIAILLPIINMELPSMVNDKNITIVSTIIAFLINYYLSYRAHKIQEQLKIALNPSATNVTNITNVIKVKQAE